jgi:hypothetical protein
LEYLIRKRLVGIGEFGGFGVVVLGILCKRLRGWDLFGCFRFGFLLWKSLWISGEIVGVLLGGLAVEKWKWGVDVVVRWVEFGFERGLWWVDGVSEGRVMGLVGEFWVGKGVFSGPGLSVFLC